jgi:hypothetical protein
LGHLEADVLFHGWAPSPTATRQTARTEEKERGRTTAATQAVAIWTAVLSRQGWNGCVEQPFREGSQTTFSVVFQQRLRSLKSVPWTHASRLDLLL